jgi:hypothetical protein
MRLLAALSALAFAPCARAAVVQSLPRAGVAVPAAWSGSLSAPALGLPALAAPSLLSAPLAAPALTAAPAPAALAPVAAAAPAAPSARVAAALPAAPAAASGPERRSGEQAAREASRMWDGFGAPRAAAAEAPEPAVTGLPAPLSEGWTRGSFESAAGGVAVAYKHRPGPAGTVPRVYAGGLALNESFDPLFARDAAPARPEYFVWMRGHPPTAWTPTASPIDADARDLARMIVRAARESGAPKVELALHSFGTLVFQRMVQLRAEPEVARALKLLSGSRVTMLNATTHYSGSEKRAGREFERMGTATKQFVGWLDSMDAAAAAWRGAADLNPFLAPSVLAGLAAWQVQREQILAMASKGAADMMRADLQSPWAPEFDAVRIGFLAALARDRRDPGWQEALLRRSSDMFRLEFTKKDAALIRRLRISLDLVHAAGDQLLNWESARTLFERLGIEAPEKAPAAGAALSDKTGLFRASIVDGDHYWPLKRRDDLSRRLDP